MSGTLIWIGLGACLIWIGVDMIRGGNWWSRLGPNDQDELIGLPPVEPDDEVSHQTRDFVRSKIGGWFAATPVLGVLGVLMGLFIVVTAIHMA